MTSHMAHRVPARRAGSMLILSLAASASACLAEAPQLDEPSVQGDYEDGDVYHRPGQPCVLCHGDGFFPIPPGEVVFEVGGTVYDGIADAEDDGLAGVEVEITDDTGLVVTAMTNRAGNFMVSVDADRATGTQIKRGWVTVPASLVFPLRARIRKDGEEQEMRTNVWRSGSCGHCHGPEPGVDSVGRVYLHEEVVP